MEPPDAQDPAKRELIDRLERAVLRAMPAPLKKREAPSGKSRTLDHMPPDMASAMLYLQAHPQSAELIRHNARRGMSLSAMNRIWGARLVHAVLDNMEVKS